MPRPLPALSGQFLAEVSKALDFTRRLEAAQVALGGKGALAGEIGLTGVELGYELAYLRVFLSWEDFLESTFYRLMCGYSRAGIQENKAPGFTYSQSLSEAESLVLGNRDYVLWHNPAAVIGRADRFFIDSPFRLVVASAQARIEYFASVRHRIAHAQEHAQTVFDQTTVSLAGRRYKGSRPGRFLRDWVPTAAPPARWLVSICDELSGLAQQICP